MKKFYSLIFLFTFVGALFAQPANNDCANAIAIGETDREVFSTIDATTDGPLGPNHIANCPGNADTEIDSIYNDIWYLYTAGFTGRALWSLCGQAAFDSKIAVYNPGSSCPPTDDDLLDCNEDGTGQFCSEAFESDLLFEVTAGETYLLRLGGFGGVDADTELFETASGDGAFSIEEFVPVVPNDLCADAIVLEVGSGIEFNSGGATTDGPDHTEPAGCFGFGDTSIMSDIWYTYTATQSGSILWSTCDMVFHDTRLGVYNPGSACPPLTEDLLACNDDGSGCTNFSSALFFDVEEGSTYLLRLGGFGGESGSGSFDFIFEAAPEPPANDLCVNAEEVSIAPIGTIIEVLGNNTNAFFDDSNFSFPQCLANQDGGEFAEVWYTFNSETATEVQLTFFSFTSDAAFFIDFWQDCSIQLDSLNVNNSCLSVDAINNSAVETVGPLEPETDYTMRVVTRLTTELPGEFSFQLNGDVTNSVEDNFYSQSTISLAPNPTSELLNIEFPLLESEQVRLEILNMVGQSIRTIPLGQMNAGTQSTNIDVIDLLPGLYLGTIHVGEHQMNFKFIKE